MAESKARETKGTLTLWVDLDLRKKVKMHMIESGTTFQKWAEALIRRELKASEKKAGC
jgi:hypothetical protein